MVNYLCWVYTYSLMMTHFCGIRTNQNTKVKQTKNKTLPCGERPRVTVKIQMTLQFNDECL